MIGTGGGELENGNEWICAVLICAKYAIYPGLRGWVVPRLVSTHNHPQVFTDRLTVSQKKSLTLLQAPPQPPVSKRSIREQNRPTGVEYSSILGNDPVPDIDNDKRVLVAAKTGDRWILARLDQEEELTSQSKMVALRDEDDPRVVFSSPSYRVIPLSDVCDPSITRGSRVHAVFPDTTAFYPATVVFLGREAVVCFDEDEEQTRHVSRKHVIPLEDGLAISQPPTKENKRDISTTPSKRQKRKPGVVGTDAEMSGGGSLISAPHSSVNGGTKIFGGGAGGQRSHGGSTGGGETYANMISKSLHNLPDQQGSFKDICNEIEQLYSSQLNWR